MHKIPLGEDWSFLIKKELIQVCVGIFNIQLHFNEGVTISIQGEDPVQSFFHRSNLSTPSSIEGMPGGAVTLLSLLGESVETVIAEDRTTLVISFSNNDELRIFDSSEQYESFTINGPNGLIVV